MTPVNDDLSRAPSSEPLEGPPPPTTRPPPTPDPESSSPTKSPPRKLPFLNTQNLRKRGRPKAISASETHVNALLIRVAALEARIERQDKKIASLEATIKAAETISGNNYDPPITI
ncbi:Protein CBG15084 [Caenorhabditis briggsae]|uniref:Protein CBG15084 n=1 Tax=Caenorhabditis briggsae TaxID=6238 RepID=A8XLC7_CAEBR|nr:Protein CBG15084 [Caenorhabditis briggsae]CAP33452.1 Protein CBG15084 [Caenorhabditis briggsae]